MKLEEMRYYVEIVNAGSINQASKTLYVAQPALSRTIASLEKELGFALLERSKHGVTPTQEGNQVYDDCIQMLGLYAECEHHWENLAYQNKEDDEPVTISIFALPMIAGNTMNKVFYEVTKNYPRIRLRLFEYQLGTILGEAIKQPFSLAVSHYNEKTKSTIYSFAKAHNMQIIPLFNDEYRLFANPCSPIFSMDQLKKSALKNYALASYSDEDLEQDPRFIDAGLTDIPKFFGEIFRLSNRYDMMNLAVNNPQILTLSAYRMTSDTPFRTANLLKPLPHSLYHIPMTYFILCAKEPSIEEKITLNTLLAFFSSLEAIPLDKTM